MTPGMHGFYLNSIVEQDHRQAYCAADVAIQVLARCPNSVAGVDTTAQDLQGSVGPPMGQLHPRRGNSILWFSIPQPTERRRPF